MSKQDHNEEFGKAVPSQAEPMEVAEGDSLLKTDDVRSGDDFEALTDDMPEAPPPSPVQRLRDAFENHNILDLPALVECIEVLWGRKGGK